MSVVLEQLTRLEAPEGENARLRLREPTVAMTLFRNGDDQLQLHGYGFWGAFVVEWEMVEAELEMADVELEMVSPVSAAAARAMKKMRMNSSKSMMKIVSYGLGQISRIYPFPYAKMMTKSFSFSCALFSV